MAYAGSVSFSPALGLSGPIGGRRYLVTISETEGAATSEAQINWLRKVNLRLLRADLTETSGTATTYHPRIGPATAPDGFNGGVLVKAAATAPPISVEGALGSVLTTSDAGLLYWRSTPDAGADNVVTVKLWFEVL